MALDRAELLEEVLAHATARGWNDTQLAAEIGISSQRLSNWKERGAVSKDGVELVGQSLGLIVTYGVAEARGTYAVRADDGRLQIPQLDVRASMGHGAMPDEHVDIVRMLSVDESELRRRVSFSSPRNLRIITGYGPSMEPTFADGDLLLVDEGIKTVDIDAIFVFLLNDRLYIKTLQRTPDGALLVISDNKRFSQYPVKPTDTMLIRGRILLVWNARRV